ncbi:MAG: cytochrome P450 [Thiohalocapsa sp.]
MTFLTNLVLIPVRLLLVLIGGLMDTARLLGLIGSAVSGDEGTFKTRALAKLGSTAGQLRLFGVLRVFNANLAISKRLVQAYENAGTVLVTRYDDVREVLERESDFAVVYEPRMRRITAGENFFLGMQRSPAYQHDVSVMRLAVRWEDVSLVVAPFVERETQALLSDTSGTIDVPAQLTLPVVARMVGRYFGTPGPTEQEMIHWTSTMFWYLFIDLGADPEVERDAMVAARACRAYLDRTIAERKSSPTDDDDVLNRCLHLQRAGKLGFDDLAIRNNLIGLIIGAIPTLSRAAVQALDQILERPPILALAREAARMYDMDRLRAIVFEALRFNPVNPVIYRRAARDCTIAEGTLRACRIPQDSMVLAATLSAMHDPCSVPAPSSFRTDRPEEHYILWGYGLHTCFGEHINRAVVPALLRPLLASLDLRRAEGTMGQIDTAGTPFPTHFLVETARR